VIDLRPHKPVPVCRFGSATTSGAAWNAPGTEIIPAGHDLTFHTAAPLAATTVEILADANDQYLVRLLRAGGVVFEFRAPPTYGAGLHWRSSAIPPLPFDTVTITPSGGDGSYSVGAVAFWNE
jgi:hypothetical protein